MQICCTVPLVINFQNQPKVKNVYGTPTYSTAVPWMPATMGIFPPRGRRCWLLVLLVLVVPIQVPTNPRHWQPLLLQRPPRFWRIPKTTVAFFVMTRMTIAVWPVRHSIRTRQPHGKRTFIYWKDLSAWVVCPCHGPFPFWGLWGVFWPFLFWVLGRPTIVSTLRYRSQVLCNYILFVGCYLV